MFRSTNRERFQNLSDCWMYHCQCSHETWKKSWPSITAPPPLLDEGKNLNQAVPVIIKANRRHLPSFFPEVNASKPVNFAPNSFGVIDSPSGYRLGLIKTKLAP